MLDECLSMEYLRSRPEAIVTIETWRKHHNGVRPHSSLELPNADEIVGRQHDRRERQLPSNSWSDKPTQIRNGRAMTIQEHAR